MAITLNSKTYNFIGFDKNGVSVYQESSSGFPSGFGYLTCRVSPATSTVPAKARWRLTMPVVADAGSTTAVPGTVLRQYTFDEGRLDVPGQGTSAERTDFSVRVKELAATTQYLASITSLIQPSS